MKRIEQIVVIFIAAALAIPSYWFFWTLAGGGGYNKRIKPITGMLILFPGYMDHYVPPNKGEGRSIVAGNLVYT